LQNLLTGRPHQLGSLGYIPTLPLLEVLWLTDHWHTVDKLPDLKDVIETIDVCEHQAILNKRQAMIAAE
jgi:hypothetical protein